MKIRLPFILFALLPLVAAAQTTTYNGPVGGYITSSGNWTSGLPTTANPGAVNTNTVFGNATGSGSPYTLDGYVFELSQSLTRGYDLISQLKNCAITVKSGGNLNVTSPTTARATRLQGNTTITVESGGWFTTFTTNSIECQSGSVTGAEPKIVINGGTVTGGFLGVQASVTSSYGVLTFGAGTGVANFASPISFATGTNAYVNFLSGSGGTLTITGQTQAYYEGLWTSGRLKVDGASTGAFADYFVVTGSSLSLISLNDPVMLVSSSYNFTSTGGSSTYNIPLSNTGLTQSLEISSVTPGGTDDVAVTSITPAMPLSILPGGSQNIGIGFTPIRSGMHQFNLAIASNDQELPSPRIVAVNVEVREPLISAVPPTLDLGIFNANPAPVTRTITVTNTSTGSRNLNISATPVSGDTAAFAVTSAPTSIAPGASGDVVVTFNPGAATGVFQATVQIQSDDYEGTAPAFTFQAMVEPAETPAVRVDFGSATTPVQADYTQFVVAEDASTTIEGVTLTLDSKDGNVISRDLGASFGNLRRDCATTPGTANGEYLRVVLTGLQAGTLNLISSHNKSEGTGPQQENILFGEVGGTLSTIAPLISRGAWVEYATTVESGKIYELRMQESSSNDSAYISSLLLWGSAVPGTSPLTPYETWSTGYGLNPAWQSGDDPATDGRPEGDPDGDSFTNHQEYLFGSIPNVPNGSLTTTEQSGNALIIRWKERADATYRLLESTTLADPWTPSGAGITDDGAPASGYQPRMATVPITGDALFLRVEGVDNN